MPFPADGPGTKYDALFDPRPAFDALRDAFMIYADPEARVTTFLQHLQEQVVIAGDADFVAKVSLWSQSVMPLDAPVDFCTRAWQAYLTCVTDGDYYFSADELLAICMQARARVIVFKEAEGVLKFVGAWLQGQGPVVLTKLMAGGEVRVRSHFERLIPASAVREFEDAVTREAQQRAREEARLRQEAAKLRREREAEAAKVRAAKIHQEAAERKARQEAEARRADEQVPPPPPAHEAERPAKKQKSAAVPKASNDVPPPPPASEGKRPAKKQKSQEADHISEQSEAGLKPSSALQQDETGLDKSEEGLGQYNVRCMPCGSSKDPRSMLEAAMTTLVEQLQEHPTIPMDSEDCSLLVSDILSDDTAPLLPPKHCAFKKCSWTLFRDGLARNTVRTVQRSCSVFNCQITSSVVLLREVDIQE